MKPTYLLLAFLVCVTSGLVAQSTYPIKSDTLWLSYDIQQPEAAPIVENAGKSLQFSKSSFENGSMRIRCEGITKGIQNLQYRVTVFVAADNGFPRKPLSAQISGNTGLFTPGQSGSFEFTLLNFYEQYRRDQTIKVAVILHQFGAIPFNCSNPPRFGIQQKLPLTIGLSAGAVVTGVGLLIKKQSLEDYETYKKNSSESNANELYNNANSKHKTGILLMEVGGGIAAGAVAVHFFNKYKFKKKTALFNEYCKTARLQPELGLIDSGAGLKFSVHF